MEECAVGNAPTGHLLETKRLRAKLDARRAMMAFSAVLVLDGIGHRAAILDHVGPPDEVEALRQSGRPRLT